MSRLKMIGAFLATLLLSLLATFSARAKQAKAERDQARQSEKIARQVNLVHQRIDRTARKLNEQHNEEINSETEKFSHRDRDQLDNDW